MIMQSNYSMSGFALLKTPPYGDEDPEEAGSRIAAIAPAGRFRLVASAKAGRAVTLD